MCDQFGEQTWSISKSYRNSMPQAWGQSDIMSIHDYGLKGKHMNIKVIHIGICKVARIDQVLSIDVLDIPINELQIVVYMGP